MDWTWVIGLASPLAVVITAGVTWAVAARKNSGKVDTTDAAVLWTEASKMRDAYRLEVERQDKEIQRQDDEIKVLREEVKEWKDEALAQRERIVELEKCQEEVHAFRLLVNRLEGELRRLKAAQARVAKSAAVKKRKPKQP